MADEAEVAATMAETVRETGFLPDPHTAVGIAVGQRVRAERRRRRWSTLATAHPAKFAGGRRGGDQRQPSLTASRALAHLMSGKEPFDTHRQRSASAVEDYRPRPRRRRGEE